ncbi:MAG: transcriptional repressor [Firmicutes bacterium]|nr:transcriptional repressor [Bacillota bacterium]
MGSREEEKMATKGIRLTRRRRAILEVFRQTTDHLSAEDVFLTLRARQIEINPTTVYRNLELLSREGLLRHVDFHDGRCRYELAEGPCHHHLHCIRCGRVVEFARCELAELEKDLSRQTNFQIHRHVLELYGICPNCRVGR